MSPPTVRVNTFVTEKEKPYVDPLSKIFIILEVMLGLDRLRLLGKNKLIYVLVPFIIHVTLSVAVIYISFTRPMSLNLMMWSKIIQNSVCALLSFTRCKWMLMYYGKLTTFDLEAGCKPNITARSIRNAVQTGLMILVIIGVNVSSVINGQLLSPQYAPLQIVYVLEVHYFSHLLDLLVPRLKLINYCIESSLSNCSSETQSILKEFVCIKNSKGKFTQCHMRKLMDLYEVVAEAYDFLIEGIKWQLLAVIISSFVAILGYLFLFSLSAIRGEEVTDITVYLVGTIFIITVPLFAPCVSGDYVTNEVKKLRELLASKLYENKLDKGGRCVARALLAFTETRNLCFRLLRMLNIDISLPFKFGGLIVTYLIILLQFEKVINP